MSHPIEPDGAPQATPVKPSLLERLRLAALQVPVLRDLISGLSTGLGEVLVVVLLLISMPLALLLIVAAFRYGGLPGGFLLVAALLAAALYLPWRHHRR
ncbi:MAG: hypothetical protein WAL91_07650 [Propionicimonas sp.]